MVKLLIVDDSSFMRGVIRKIVSEDSNISIIGEAENGAVAVDMAKELNPDVITMDIEMPVMDGLWATARIMAANPCPIIMLSAHVKSGAVSTFKAIELGAVDFIPKESNFSKVDISQISSQLNQKIRYWANHAPLYAKEQPSQQQSKPVVSPRLKPIKPKRVDLVVIGVSTGGPQILPELLRSMGTLPCPVVIAQHMPDLFFTKSFVEHMASKTGLNVLEGKEMVPLEPGSIVFVPGGTDGEVRRAAAGFPILFFQKKEEESVHPSVDVLFHSALTAVENPVGIILTGMGRDGTEGAKAFIDKNMPILVQEPGTCVVAGMPESAIQAGAVSKIMKAKEIGRQVVEWCAK